jgi:putative ubiquitin-RnfH superfamily antitoxin RatB of RatAB toxin-antitoxin module
MTNELLSENSLPKNPMRDETNDSSRMVDVVCARVNQTGQAEVKSYQVAQGTTAAAFVRQCGFVDASQTLPVMGVFSRKIAQPEQYILQQCDRLELYQPLILSPMDVRRARARAHPVGRLKHRQF